MGCFETGNQGDPMAVSPTAVDHFEPACEAVARSTPLLVEAIRRAPGAVRPTRMRWTNAEIASHLYGSVVEAGKVARGVPSLYDGSGPTVALDERIVASVSERDVAVLSGMVEQATAQFLATVRQRSGDEPVAVPGATVSTMVGLIALDHHLHGGQFAETAGSQWSGRFSDLHPALSIVLPYAFDPRAARRFHGSYLVRLKGVEPIRYGIENGVLHLDLTGRTDCTLTSDPQTFLRMGIGVVSQVRATLTGKVRAGGRKPWLAMATNRLFPPIPHGGVR
jgi:hypothetical protein